MEQPWHPHAHEGQPTQPPCTAQCCSPCCTAHKPSHRGPAARAIVESRLSIHGRSGGHIPPAHMQTCEPELKTPTTHASATCQSGGCNVSAAEDDACLETCKSHTPAAYVSQSDQVAGGLTPGYICKGSVHTHRKQHQRCASSRLAPEPRPNTKTIRGTACTVFQHLLLVPTGVIVAEHPELAAVKHTSRSCESAS